VPALDIAQEFHILAAMVSHLKPYLYEGELFGHIDNRMPKLTIGGLLLRLHRLEGLERYLTPEQRTQLYAARQQFETLRYEWQTHYRDKILQEIQARLNTLKWFLDDCANNPESCAGGWLDQAEKRTIVAHLCQEAEHLDALPGELRNEIAAVDSRLRGYQRRGEFLWDERLKDSYPPDEWWWLYGRPSES
jgi:hypothetical protein